MRQKETTIFKNKHKSLTYKTLETGLHVSEAGFGYRINNENEDFKTALQSAISNGINLIDTSANYTDGDSEYCVGEVLGSCIKDSIRTRENIVVVTKLVTYKEETFKNVR